MRRRECALGLAGLAAPWTRAGAQASEALPKLGILAPSGEEELLPGSSLHGMLAGLKDLGYVDGRSIDLEFRFAHHAIEQLPMLAAELVATEPDVIYTWSSGAARALVAATATIPIIVAPVAADTMAALVPDFARPPLNVTGLPITSTEQRAKCLQLLKEAAPGVSRVGVLLNPLNPAWDNYPEVLRDAANALGLDLFRAEARGAEELDQAFAIMAARKVDGLLALNESTLTGTPAALAGILDLVGSRRLPSVADDADFARAGGLLGLGPDYPSIGLAASDYVHRILQGAQVAELPVMLPTSFVLVVNLSAAEQLGIEIPQSVLLRADEVIE